MKQVLYDALTANPVIAAVKDETGLQKCLRKEDIAMIFILFGEVGNIEDIVDRIKQAGKIAIVHIDLIAGLGTREEAAGFIARYTRADGIISTRAEILRRAKQLDLSTIYRVFVIDSKAVSHISGQLDTFADIVEILPGLMPKVIRSMKATTKLPIIAGGLLEEKEDVLEALDAGAIAISTTNENVWNM